MTHRTRLASLVGLLTCALLTVPSAHAASTSPLTGIALPPTARPLSGSDLQTLAGHLGRVIRTHALPGTCQAAEAFALRLDDDDAVDALEQAFTTAGYATTDLPGPSTDELAFTLRKGARTVVAVIRFGDRTVLAWCALGAVGQAAATGSTTARVPTGSTPTTRAPTPAPPAAPKAAPPAPAPRPATAGLSGLYFRIRMLSTSSIEEYFYFLPDGRVTLVLPEGGLDPLDPAWLARLQRDHPEDVATYRLEGPDIVFTVPGQPAWRETFAREANGNLSLGGHFTSRVKAFPAGQRLQARYTYAGGASGGGTAVSAGSSLTLRSDGTFTASGVAGASMAAGGQTETARSAAQRSGRYQLVGNTLILSSGDGRTTRHTVFPYVLTGHAGANPDWFYLDGMQMKLVR